MNIVNISQQPEKVFSLLQTLRVDLTFKEFEFILFQAAAADNFQFFGLFNEQEDLQGIIGCRILYDFLHGKHLYIDDLVAHTNARKMGVGKLLLNFAEGYAAEHKCNIIRVSTGSDYKPGIEFYEQIGWKIKAVTFKKGIVI